MKGIVFTEFLDMVEARFTPEVADRMITAAAVPSSGAYTAVGTYDYHEIIQLVVQLSNSRKFISDNARTVSRVEDGATAA